jgi:hypothetical protein
MSVVVRAIDDSDLDAVGRFLHQTLNDRVSASAWTSAMSVPWKVDAPNYGFLLEDGGRVVGAYLAFYSERRFGDDVERLCNLGAWCVAESHRTHSLKLLKALLAQQGYTFTDLSPSGSVVPLNRRLKFTDLDTTTVLVPCLPWPSGLRRAARPRVVHGPAVADHLSGRDLEIYRDHADAAAARHVVLLDGDASCYVIFRHDRRKNIPAFASVLYVSDPTVLRRGVRSFARHLLLRHGVLAILAELRVIGFRPGPAKQLANPRRKMFKSTRLRADQIDYLYSELTCVAW